jgi:hypothetical protein
MRYPEGSCECGCAAAPQLAENCLMNIYVIVSFALHRSRSKLSTYTFQFLHHSMPHQLVNPLTTPIRLTFPDGIELISSIESATNLHLVQCDLCGKVN